MQNNLKLSYVTDYVKKKKLIFTIIAVAGLGLLLYFVLLGSKSASGEYLTDTVKKDNIISSISASGMVEPVSVISLSFKNAEVISKIHVKVGDHVKPGQLLAELETENLESGVRQAEANLNNLLSKLELLKNGSTPEELEQAEADVSMAQAAYDQAKGTMDRQQILYQSGALSLVELEQTKVEFINADSRLKQAKATLRTKQLGNRPEDIASAAAQVEGSQAQLELAKGDLVDARMLSSIEGIISLINGAEGQRATANNNSTSGGGFMEVISEAMQVKAQVNEGDIGRVQAGQQVEFVVNSFPDKTFSGKLSSISPKAYTESNVQIYDVMVQLDENYPELKAGMPANVKIIIERHDNVLTVPKGAVTYAVSYLNKMRSTEVTQGQGINQGENSGRQGQRAINRQSGSGEEGGNAANGGANAAAESGQGRRAAVLVLDKTGDPAPRQVTLGSSDLTKYEVLSGLNEGDTVIVGTLSQPTASGATTGSGGGQLFMPTGGIRR